MGNHPGSGINIVDNVTLHQVVREELASIAKMPPASPPLVAGKWHLPVPHTMSQSLLSEGVIQVMWYPIPYGTVVTGLAINVQTAGSTGALHRLVAYKHNIATGLPDALFTDAGTVDVTTTGVKEKATSGSPTVDNYGGLWVGGVQQGAPTTRATLFIINSWSPALVTDPPNFTVNLSGWQTTASTHTGAAPANIGALAVSGAIPKVFVEVG